jgi:hypothetical protein
VLADATPRDDSSALSLGKLVRGTVTGRWQATESEQRALSGSVGSQGGFTVPDCMSRDAHRPRPRSAGIGRSVLARHSAQVSSPSIRSWR